jgi:CheY-like chemotaxis protein/signal transduction histidine kinase/methyl-accepting chemotaxis protein
MDAVRILSQHFSDHRKIEMPQRRVHYSNMLKNILDQNDSYLSLWTIWEPRSIDTLDRYYIGELGSTALGNYSPTFYKHDGKIFLEDNNTDDDVSQLLSSDYYVQPKTTRKETIMNPNYYSYTSKKEDQIFQTNLISPIITDGEFMGVVGLDISLETLENTVATIEPYQDSKALLVTNDGIIVTHPDASLQGNSVLEAFDNVDDEDELLTSIKNGESLNLTVELEGERYLVAFDGVHVGETGTPWSIGVLVPYRYIMSGAYTSIIVSISISVLGILLISLIIVYIASKITRPISDTTEILKDLSKGKLDKIHELKVESQDEIGEMAIALNKLGVSLRRNSDFAAQIGEGNFESSFTVMSKEDILGNALLKMQKNLQAYAEQRDKINWMQTATMSVSEILRGEKTPEELGDQLLSMFSELVDVKMGAMYLYSNDKLEITSSYAFDTRRSGSLSFKIGEGMIGQSVKENKIIHFTDVPEDYMLIQSGFGAIVPKVISIIPLIHDKQIIGVIELGFSETLNEDQIKFIENIRESVSIGFNSIKVKYELDILVKKTLEQSDKMQIQQEQLQQQNEEMQVQQEQLKKSNEELEYKSNELQKSEENLQSQQEELRVINEELEEKTKSLENEKKKVTEQNEDLELAKKDLEVKAEELEQSSQYKSEFLANMSHELRTPLNSLLILSKNLGENHENNLQKDQIEALDIIYNSGNDLLKLINDILDLSKIESGKMNMNFENFDTHEIVASINQNFNHVAKEKGLDFNVHVETGFPSRIYTDFQRLGQIMKNLISNAIKFTQEGSVNIDLITIEGDDSFSLEGLQKGKILGIRVKDTGIGVAHEKIQEIFEAFKQADGSTSRKYGGTGLGLSISRELANLLGGEIKLVSEQGKGSEFTVYLPIINYDQSDLFEEKNGVQLPKVLVGNKDHATPIQNGTSTKKNKKKAKKTEEEVTVEVVSDDRDSLQDNLKTLLVVEDDVYFAKILYKQAKSKGFQCLVSHRGTEGLAVAEKYNPDAIILDINLPDVDGLKILDNLKKNPETRHIPVQMMSAYEESIDAFNRGAIGYTTKPVSVEELDGAFKQLGSFMDREMKELLLVEDDANLRKSIKVLIGEQGTKITDASSGEEAIKLISEKKYDCMILDLGLPDMTGFELLKKLKESKTIITPPVIVYTGKDISREENNELEKYAKSIIIKGVKSEERLLDETALFLHKVVKELPEEQQNIITNLHDKNRLFAGKKVLVVDDDMRNVFALAKVLKEKEVNVLRAENGKVGLDLLKSNPDIDLVLMDIMMPVMDGYEAITEIRKLEEFKEIPVIALTAKAMKKDQDKCMEAGASDYLSKPLNLDRLFSLMRVWLYNN